MAGHRRKAASHPECLAPSEVHLAGTGDQVTQEDHGRTKDGRERFASPALRRSVGAPARTFPEFLRQAGDLQRRPGHPPCQGPSGPLRKLRPGGDREQRDRHRAHARSRGQGEGDDGHAFAQPSRDAICLCVARTELEDTTRRRTIVGVQPRRGHSGGRAGRHRCRDGRSPRPPSPEASEADFLTPQRAAATMPGLWLQCVTCAGRRRSSGCRYPTRTAGPTADGIRTSRRFGSWSMVRPAG